MIDNMLGFVGRVMAAELDLGKVPASVVSAISDAAKAAGGQVLLEACRAAANAASLNPVTVCPEKVGTAGELSVGTLNLGAFGNIRIADVITFGIRALFVIAGLTALLFLLTGALTWITSGGNKENIQKAQEKIQAAIIGLIVVLAVVAVVALLEQVLKIGLGVTEPIVFPKLVP